MKGWLTASVLIAGILMATSACAGSGNGDNPANPLITDRGKFRPLIIMTPDARQPAYQHLRQQLENSQDRFNDRDMVLYTIEADQGTRHGRPMTPFEIQALVEALGVSPNQGVTTILVGKDGGKKVQQRGDLELQQIYDTIDRMPMRRSDGS